jgi:hypothetical protein
MSYASALGQLALVKKQAAAADVLALTKAEAIAKAKKAARAQIEAKVSDMRQRGIADAKVGKYAAPAPTAPPDFDTMNYQAGWLSTGAALPPGVVPVGAGGIPRSPAGASGPFGSGDQNKMLIVGGVVCAVALLFILKR